ncbi:MAG: hypothetical protein PF484_03845 [Bacteroidales bacterium]|jgi:hypothetical protein|nr:hypothetical protein [Bacteroidales bacterium]
MSLNKGKHIVKEIEDVLCTVVESGINAERIKFLKTLLEFNKFEVKFAEDSIEGETKTYILGVTDLEFNPVISVYEQSLKRPDVVSEKVSPVYWNQEPEIDQLPYFDYREKNPNAENDDDFLPNPWAYRTI